MLSIEEIDYDQLYMVKETGAFIRVNQVDRDAETIADRVGNWYDIEDLEATQ